LTAGMMWHRWCRKKFR